jgi:hypothetical protein
MMRRVNNIVRLAHVAGSRIGCGPTTEHARGRLLPKRRSGHEEEFFFEKKNEKTFARLRARCIST